jgi:type I restriction enzyme S subunit
MSNASTLLIGGDGAAQNTPVPEGWLLASLEGLTLKIGDVDHRMPKAVTNGIPYVSTKDFQGTEDIDYAGAKKISREDFETLCRKIRPEYGDLLISRYGTIGQVRRVKNSEEFQASYSSAIVKTVNVGTLVDYLVIALRSEPLQAQMMRHVRASSQPDLGLEYIRKLEIPLPPLAEQHRIVEEVERRLSVVEEMEKTVAHGLKRAERLRQAILRKAFAGELVPQDSADEPASVLLERIRAERAANGAGAKRTASRKKVAVGQGVLL